MPAKKKPVVENPYVKAGEPLLSYCVFMDILGFSTEVLEADRKNTFRLHFKHIYKAFVEASKSIRGEDEYSLRGDDEGFNIYQIKLFSDNVVIGGEVSFNLMDDIDDESLFGYFIFEVMRFQMEMAVSGWFLRGGWSVGGLYMDDHMIYGKALVDAHRIECEDAIYPIVLLSEPMYWVVQRHLEYYTAVRESAHYCHLLSLGRKKYFVNYLYNLIVASNRLNTGDLAKHKSHILRRYNNIRRRKRFGKQKSILAKYEWLIDYHNFFTDKFLGRAYVQYRIRKSFGNKIYLLK